MAYSELIKNFEKIRSYMREFYVYGFKSREDYDKKSLRSYDDERRRVESWLGDYMGFRQTADGKNVFLSIDSRATKHNPLYKAWKTKSFTDGDITLHFILFDIFASAEESLSVADIMKRIDRDYLSCFAPPMLFDESTVRKKLKEYESEGLLRVRKAGRQLLYSADYDGMNSVDAALLDFYSEVAPCGVVGSYLLDKLQSDTGLFAFKHHYITQTLDSGVLYDLLSAISEKREVVIEATRRNREITFRAEVVPLQIFVSVQSGRQHLMCRQSNDKQIKSFRLDYIGRVELGEISEEYDELNETLNRMKKHMWGVMCKSDEHDTEKVEFTVHMDDDEEFIYRRLLREKRCGSVERLNKNTCRFTAEVYDTNEMVPWIRTFICRITDIHLSNRRIEEKFKRDIDVMYTMYGIGGDGNAVQ